MKGILLSLVILIPTILPRQTPLVPFPEIFSTYIGAHLSKRQFCLRPLSREPFFNLMPISRQRRETQRRFRPLSRGLFFNMDNLFLDTFYFLFSSPFSRTFFNYTAQVGIIVDNRLFSSPFLGTFFQLLSKNRDSWGTSSGFRPLSRGPFFNKLGTP